jgi:hypothetical protein
MSESYEDLKEKALKHIKRCDEIFDGNVVRQDREFAYHEMRLLALELLEELECSRSRSYFRSFWEFC